MIEVKGLKKAFGSNEVLKGIDTVINKGEKVVVIGPSGSGKSTFLRCLNRLETPTAGSIVFGGVDITNAPEKQLYKIREKALDAVAPYVPKGEATEDNKFISLNYYKRVE